MTDSINKIGAEVAKALRELEKGADALDVRRDAAQSKLRQVWDALERGEIVNGCTTKKAWASFAKVDIRTCQYTLKGKRNRSAEVKKRSANHVVRYQELLKELITVVCTGSPEMVTDKVSAICEQIKWMPPDSKKKEEESEAKQPKNPVVTEMEKTLEAMEPITVPDQNKEEQCDYTEDEVAAMFAQGGK
jgi:hypothetical protein